YETVATADTGNQEQFMLRLRQDGVTTVFCLCSSLSDGLWTGYATNQGFFPEWLVSTYLSEDSNAEVRLAWRPEQREHLMGLTAKPRQIAWPNDPTSWALDEGNPGAPAGAGYYDVGHLE